MSFLYLSFLEPNNITVNTTICCIIQQQLNNRKFIHHSDSMTIICRVSREKSIQPIVNKNSTMKTIVTVLKRLLTVKYRIYSLNRPGRLLNFWTLRMGAYSRWALIRGWALIKFSPFSASKICLFYNKTINANKK